MLMAVNEPYALMVQPDDILISPREVDEHFGTMVCFHPRYALGDHHNHIRSIRVIGKDELHIEFNYQDEYKKAVALAEQIAEQAAERKAG